MLLMDRAIMASDSIDASLMPLLAGAALWLELSRQAPATPQQLDIFLRTTGVSCAVLCCAAPGWRSAWRPRASQQLDMCLAPLARCCLSPRSQKPAYVCIHRCVCVCRYRCKVKC